MAFQLRAERHALEKVLMEVQKGIEQRRADVAELSKTMKFHEEVYAREKETLLVFRVSENICNVLSLFCRINHSA